MGKLLAILAKVTWPWAQPLDESISLKFLLETRSKSKSFQPLIDFPEFLVQKQWSKNMKLVILPKRGNFTKIVILPQLVKQKR